MNITYADLTANSCYCCLPLPPLIRDAIIEYFLEPGAPRVLQKLWKMIYVDMGMGFSRLQSRFRDVSRLSYVYIVFGLSIGTSHSDLGH